MKALTASQMKVMTAPQIVMMNATRSTWKHITQATVKISGNDTQLEPDTGSDTNIMDEHQFKKLQEKASNVALKWSDIKSVKPTCLSQTKHTRLAKRLSSLKGKLTRRH